MIEENLALCRGRIGVAAGRAGRDSSAVTLVAVTKGVDVSRVREAIVAGVRHIGENRVQETIAKQDTLNRAAGSVGAALSWHMIGHLQTNKAKDAVRLFDMIHSVDSLRLAEAINREAGKITKTQDVLLEVNVSAEASKYGFSADGLRASVRELSVFPHLRVKGLMTVAPQCGHPEQTRGFFRQLRSLGQEIGRLPFWACPFCFLSMGMTEDFEVAVEEGSTHVRIGRGLFGSRLF